MALAAMFGAYDLLNGWHGISYLAARGQLDPDQAGLLGLSATGGFAAGAFLQGHLSDRLGRRPAILLGLWLTAIFSVAIGVSGETWWAFFAWRFLTGVGVGVLLPAILTYLPEIASGLARATFAMLPWTLGGWLGASAAGSAGVYVTPVYGWRMVYVLGATSGLLALACHIVMIESPSFLLMRRRVSEDTGGPAEGDPTRPAPVVGRTPNMHHPSPSAARGLLSRDRRTTLAVCGASFFGLFSAYGFLLWLPLALLEQGETGIRHQLARSAALSMIFVGTMGCGFASDRLRLGRAAPAIWWLFGGAGALVLSLGTATGSCSRRWSSRRLAFSAARGHSAI
ncbi:MAG: MFS transporter [Acidobacteriota bacterium]